MRHLHFLKNFMKDRYIGALTPTTSFCVRRVCRKMDLSKDKVIVEYGPGDGPYTEHILSKMSRGSTLIAIETNKVFVAHLKKIKDKRLIVIEGSAEDVKKILADLKLKKADYVLSGIPFSFFPRRMKIRIIRNTYDVLKNGGQFLVYQYSFHVKKYLRRYFKKIRTDFEPINLPPYFIMQAIKSVP